MTQYLIEGGKKLTGTVKISGNKNAVLPLLAATLLTDQPITLRNVPQILDVEVFLEILNSLGSKIERGANWLKLTTPTIKSSTLPQGLATRLRASILLAGPLLARSGQVNFYHPGGDVVGKRSINVHLEGLKSLGYQVKALDRHYLASGAIQSKPVTIFLSEASVTATENLILASVLGKSQVILKNCAQEPHVVELCQFLKLMGAQIKGMGTNQLTISGVAKLKGADYTLGVDYIEIGTYAIAAALTGGKIAVHQIGDVDLDPIMQPLGKFGLRTNQRGKLLTFQANKLQAVEKLVTNIWPGFPTDLMSVAIVLATQADGVTLCHDWMYESRMFFVDKLISMGANITIADPHRVLVYGPTTLHGRNLETPDIRAGMALVLAALAAKGKSVINRAELIERGYEDVVGNLSKLGASIKRVD